MAKPNTRYLTGLRGYSALAVFFIHSAGGGIGSLGDWIQKLIDFGKLGVISFFVLSAFTLSMSMDRTVHFSYPHYLSRRIARILPMYSIAILFFWWLGGATMFGVQPHNAYDLFAHLTFINLWDVRYQNTVIGVEWTVPIEMWIYLLIPPLIIFVNRFGLRWGVAALVLAIAISAQNYRWHTGAVAAHWAADTYLYCFVMGILAHQFWGKISFSNGIADVLVGILLILIGALAVNGEYLANSWSVFLYSISPRLSNAGGSNLTEHLFTILVTALVITLSQAHRTRVLFENGPIVFVGNVCFPFYLLHLPILNYLKNLHFSIGQTFILGLIFTSIISYLFHIIVEKPTLKLTGKLHPYDR